MKRTVSAKNLLIERAHLLESSPNNLHNALCILSTTFVIILVTNLIHFTLSFYGEHMTRVMRTIFDAKNSINDCFEGHYSFCSSTMQCLKYNQRCDRFQDCPDDADEINCVCLKEEYQCKNGRCISMQFLCDKVNDCPSNDDEDEQLCGKCGKSFFQCKGVNGKCVPEEKMCDGKFDCREGEDEDECFSLSKKNDLIFKKTFFGGSLVCYEGWKKEIDNNICELLSRGSSIRSFPSINTRLKRFVEIRRINETLTLAQKSRCPKDEIVTLICEERECGKRKINEKYFSGYIINGIETMNGEIPWQVSLKSDFGVCGGSLIAPQWVLTASHCVYKKGQVSKSLIAFFGSNFLASRNWVASGVIKVIPYFNSDYRENFDVALLKLVKTLSFNNYIQPICLPHKRFIESDYLYCISTGFGTTTKDFSSPILLKQRMRARKAASRGTLCIGTYTGQKYPNLCMGDSGGPFACRSKSQDKWTLVGVHKKVAFNRSAVDPKRPATLCQESYVTLVETMNDWINKQMEEN